MRSVKEMYAVLARVRLPEGEGRQPELKMSSFKEVQGNVSISGSGTAPGRGGKAAGAENEQL